MKIYIEDSVQDEPVTKEDALNLKQEILKLKEVNQILKKFMPIFAKKTEVWCLELIRLNYLSRSLDNIRGNCID